MKSKTTGAARGSGKAGAKRATMPKTRANSPTSRPRATTRTAAKRTTGRAREEKAGTMEGPAGRRLERNAPARLRPITQRQSRSQILATIATDAGVERPIVERVARSLSHTVQRHLMRNGSGRVEIPYLGAALWRGREGARKARKMASPILKGRIVEIPARRAMAVARLRVHSALREIVART